MYGLSGSAYFPHYPKNGVVLGRKLLNIKSLSEKFLFQEESSDILLKMYVGLHVKYPLLLRDFNGT